MMQEFEYQFSFISLNYKIIDLELSTCQQNAEYGEIM